ncbi:hypothetical protein JOD69_002551 [Methylocaldum sp. RMAD-M]|nr:hypothetical protein [Methylocaldum sp. RMAD-M]
MSGINTLPFVLSLSKDLIRASLSRHSGRDCSPHPWGSSYGPCSARPNLLLANLCRTNRQGEAQCGERAGQGRTAQDSRAKRDGVAWRGRFAREAPVGCRTGTVRHESSAQGSERPLPSIASGPRHSNRKRCLREGRGRRSRPGRLRLEGSRLKRPFAIGRVIPALLG